MTVPRQFGRLLENALLLVSAVGGLVLIVWLFQALAGAAWLP